MSDIIRRGKKIPVEARRVEPPIEMVSIPAAAAASPQYAPAPPPAPNVTQNIFYVNVREGQPAPQAAPPEHREVHHHTTNVYLAPKRRRLGRATSFFGTLGFVLGLLAAGAAYLPEVMWLAKFIALAGLASAGLGLLSAILLGHVGKTMPLMGLLVSALAYGLWLKGTGQLPAKYEQMVPKNVPLPSAGGVNPASSVTATPPTPPVDHSIFGDGSGTWIKPSGPAPAPAAVVDPSAAAAVLENARNTVAARLGLDYTAAKSADADAFTAYQQARLDDALGSPELGVASRNHIQAQSRLNEIEEKLRADPAVTAAELAVKNAGHPAP